MALKKNKKPISKVLILVNFVILLLFVTNAVVGLNNRDILNEKISNEPTTPSVKILSINYNEIQYNNSMSMNFILTGLVAVILNGIIILKYL